MTQRPPGDPTDPRHDAPPDGGGGLRALFEQALAQPEPAREPWARALPIDEALRSDLLRLLRAAARPQGPFDTPALARAASIGDDVEPAAPEGLIGERVGAFRLTSLLGQGGMATVFLGEREGADFRQEVAVKLLRRGLYSEVEQRLFRRERQALASLSHPNIAHLIDGGVTAGGIPYLAIEFVDGARITDHVSERQLGLRERLRLFVVVCRAVEAAHRQLIVHRDIKPSNILVTRDGVVKLLDFGIAKLLDEGAEQTTRTGLVPLTPGYAAPEQYAGASITTATDVYALGVLLHELLLGERPLSVDPVPRPSSRVAELTTDLWLLPAPRTALRAALKGDLDNILDKALAVEPERRYPTAAGLADDIERHLDAQPVTAHPPSRLYRARKFVQRHRGGVVVTALLVLAVFASLGVALWQADVARRSAVLARDEAVRAGAVRDFLVSVFRGAQPELPSERRPSIEQLVDEAAERALADTAMSEPVRTDLIIVLATVEQSLGGYDRALALLDRATTSVDRIYARDDPQWLRPRLVRASTLISQARYAETVELLDPLRAQLAARTDLIGVEGLQLLADGMNGANRFDDAQALYDLARDAARKLPESAVETVDAIDAAQARSLIYAQRFTAGLALADATLQRWRSRGNQADPVMLTLLRAISTAAEAAGDATRAEAAYRDAIDMAERLHRRPHQDTAWVIGIYGSFLVAQARYAEAEPYLLRALEMRRNLLGDSHPDTLNGMAAMGRLRGGQKNHAEALRWFAEGIALCRRAEVRHNVCPRLLGSHAQLLNITGDPAGAAREAAEAVALQRELTGPDSPQVVATLGFLARIQVGQGLHVEALRTTDELLALHERTGGMAKDRRFAQFQRAQALFGLERNDEALVLAIEVTDEHKATTPNDQATLFSMLLLEARCLSRAGRHDEARAAATEALAIESATIGLSAEASAGLRRLARTGRGY
jgi:tetratricopeptide (TPR) repeat protein